MNPSRPSGDLAVVGLLLSFALGLGSSGCGPTCSEPADGTVLLSELPGLCTTADARQQEQIRALVAARSETDVLAPVTVDYPREGTVFPPEIVAPTVVWHDEAELADRWLVDVRFEDDSHVYALVEGGPARQDPIDPRCLSDTNEIYEGTAYQQSAETWRPDPEIWSWIQDRSNGRIASLEISGFAGEQPIEVASRGRVTFSTSSDPVGAPIFYRDVPLMPGETEDGVIKPLVPDAVPLIDWRLRDIAYDESRIVLRDMPTCANCHSFSDDGSTLGMDVDGPQGDKGAYAIVALERQTMIDDADVITWNDFPDKTIMNTLGFLARMSPDGQYSIATVNEELYVMNFKDHEFSQVFFPTRGILATYSRQTGQIQALPGADDPEYVHCDGVWSPDGETIVFARARARDAYDHSKPRALYAGDPNETQIQYDLYRMPFNGGRGGTPEPIEGAADNGMSNSFPKISPDGKWVVFVKSSNGQLMRPDGRLWIVPLEGGKAREMNCNTSLMNSWHSFSPNGRWMVFSSKSNTPYTQMFLTHIDEDGNDTPPVLIENSTAPNRAVNIPEFVNVAYEDFTDISVPAVDHYLHFKRGTDLAQEGQREQAVQAFEKALEGGDQSWRLNDWRIHESLSKVLIELGETERSLAHVRASLALNPYNAEMQANMGYLLSELGQYGQAMEHLDIAIRLEPRNAIQWVNRGKLRLQVGDVSGAIEDLSQGIKRYPIDPDYWFLRGMARWRAEDLRGALEDLEKACEIAPDDWSRRAEADDIRSRLLARVGKQT